jgi:hypothetical protein
LPWLLRTSSWRFCSTAIWGPPGAVSVATGAAAGAAAAGKVAGSAAEVEAIVESLSMEEQLLEIKGAKQVLARAWQGFYTLA